MERAAYSTFWETVAAEWAIRGDARLKTGSTGAYHLPLGPVGTIHYEWHLHINSNSLDIALDFEILSNRAENIRRAEIIHRHRNEIQRGIAYPFCCGFYGEQWARSRFIIQIGELAIDGPALAVTAVDVMAKFVGRTHSLIGSL